MTSPAPLFGKDQAASYDDRWKTLYPINQALHFLSGIALAGLPAEAEILCVGAGTGAEILALSRERPGWRFLAVDPSGYMLDVCRANVEKAGISDRCRFHEGFVDSLPQEAVFDGATAILVSQFVMDRNERKAFFAGIRTRLRPGAPLITADLASPDDAALRESLLDDWATMLAITGVDAEAARASTAQWGKAVAVLPPEQVAEIIAGGGFERPTLFYQALFIHAWHARA